MNLLIIFGAKYLYLVAIAITAISFWYLARERKRTTAFFGIIDLTAIYLVGLITGYLYDNPRPFVSDHITPLISHAADNGFPSDHTLLVAALASILYCHNRTLGLIVFGIALLIGVSRVFAGIHHWIDIAGSLIIAVVVTAIVYKVSRKRLYV
jgi:undecaprenyl-diphosphatase